MAAQRDWGNSAMRFIAPDVINKKGGTLGCRL
jgi:hypothetical protein